ncbi:transposase [Holospora undulata]|uniref:Transposase DDE domain-containing protein n=1 Tax=Holospora undulata HU1 TaxID=1321371 RepID=A0A061JI01_9PROT|nr:transposase [Holospora undulata]ETZ05083.1 hypothetical protein K737_300487 [Holospora undulata HU1]
MRTILNKAIAISEHISQGWAILPKRWIVERTFAWLNHLQRVSKDYEISIETAEKIAHSMILLRRIAKS